MLKKLLKKLILTSIFNSWNMNHADISSGKMGIKKEAENYFNKQIEYGNNANELKRRGQSYLTY